MKVKVRFELEVPESTSWVELDEYLKTVLEMQPQSIPRGNLLYEYDFKDLSPSNLQIELVRVNNYGI